MGRARAWVRENHDHRERSYTGQHVLLMVGVNYYLSGEALSIPSQVVTSTTFCIPPHRQDTSAGKSAGTGRSPRRLLRVPDSFRQKDGLRLRGYSEPHKRRLLRQDYQDEAVSASFQDLDNDYGGLFKCVCCRNSI